MSKTVNIPGNINTSGGELQNVKMQSLSATPADAAESRFWYDSVNHKPVYHNGTTVKDFGKEYSEFTGADGTNAGTAGLVKAPTATDNTKFLKGDGTWGTPDNTTYTFSTGLTNTSGTITVTDYALLLKNLASQAEYSLAIGNQASIGSSYSNSLALGRKAVVSANSAIQLGYGTNSTATTLYIGFRIDSQTTNNWQLLDGTTGLIPDARLSSNIARTSALSSYIPTSDKGANNGVAELDSNGKVPSSQLPSYVDDVIEAYIVSGATALSSGWLSATSGGSALTPETGKIYVILSSGQYQNKTYRWSGTTYVDISSSPGQATELEAGIAEIATQTEVGAGADDTKIVTPAKLYYYVRNFVTHSYVVENPALTVSSGGVTWEIDTTYQSFGEVASVRVYVISTGETIFVPYKTTKASTTVNTGSGTSTVYYTDKVIIEMLASSNIAANTYRAVIMG